MVFLWYNIYNGFSRKTQYSTFLRKIRTLYLSIRVYKIYKILNKNLSLSLSEFFINYWIIKYDIILC